MLIRSQIMGAVNVPVMSFDNIKKVIDKKLQFAYDRHLTYEVKLKSQLNRLNSEIESLKSSKVHLFNINREQILKQKGKLEKDLEEYSKSIISEGEFRYIKKISSLICECFENEKIIFLANNSIRNYLRIHAEFLSHLLSLHHHRKQISDTEIISLSNITTEFLSWIHSVNEYFGIETFNIIEELGTYQNSISNKRYGCFLPYLLLTRIWNECIHLNGKPSPENNPYVRVIINDLTKDFKYTETEIRQALYNLYRQVGGKGNFITFRTKKNIENPDDIDPLSTVRITYRGRVTLGHITNSYGYIKECSERFRSLNDIEISSEELVFEKLKTIAQIHINALKKIKEKLYKDNPNWYRNYLRKYGIPLKPQFVRNSSIGVTIKNTRFNRCLYLESVFDALSSYFHLPNQNQKILDEVSKDFYLKLNQLVKEEQ